MFEEFKKFALKGNMIDMAVGIIIGAAFGTVVKSLVSDVINPIIAAIFNTPDFSNFFLFCVIRVGQFLLPSRLLVRAVRWSWAMVYLSMR